MKECSEQFRKQFRAVETNKSIVMKVYCFP